MEWFGQLRWPGSKTWCASGRCSAGVSRFGTRRCLEGAGPRPAVMSDQPSQRLRQTTSRRTAHRQSGVKAGLSGRKKGPAYLGVRSQVTDRQAHRNGQSLSVCEQASWGWWICSVYAMLRLRRHRILRAWCGCLQVLPSDLNANRVRGGDEFGEVLVKACSKDFLHRCALKRFVERGCHCHRCVLKGSGTCQRGD